MTPYRQMKMLRKPIYDTQEALENLETGITAKRGTFSRDVVILAEVLDELLLEIEQIQLKIDEDYAKFYTVFGTTDFVSHIHH